MFSIFKKNHDITIPDIDVVGLNNIAVQANSITILKENNWPIQVLYTV